MWGKGRGDRVLPVGASDWVRGGLWLRRHGKGRRWWLCVAGDGAPTAMGGGGWAWELRWGEVKVSGVFDLEGRGRRRGSTYGRRPAAQMGATVAADSGGAAPSGLGGQDLAVELQGEVGMPFRGLAWAEEGWRRELGGGARAAAMAALFRRGRWPGWPTGGSGRWSRKG